MNGKANNRLSANTNGAFVAHKNIYAKKPA
jgi:hypothetical protein